MWINSRVVRRVHINLNTASFSPNNRGYFYTDPKDHTFVLEVVDNYWMQSTKETAELSVSARTFLAYIAAHPPAVATSADGPAVDVLWEEWGPYGAHLVNTKDTSIIRRSRACGMRVLGSALSKKSVTVVDYHPGRVARSATATVDGSSVSISMGGGGTLSGSATAATGVGAQAPIPAPALAQRVGTFSSESHSATGTGTITPTRMPRCFPRPVCAAKEVPLPPELQNASESPCMMLCEDALLAFEVSGWILFYFAYHAAWNG
jgi:hypothetical protein